ncbi:glutaredoxin-like protein C5orf63 homolog [Anopheles aquasalis]|uniref:glutaredoxin-like protein C5orf63 homolog n=1 Tax=Anopheles aquasalis TaxID=42839 RepID=UPI00215B11DD|nr:glutaredoxin-like protein C5orf63 homolog [Anopheles aquasalis]
MLTLYTHDHCSLCDELVEQLEAQFAGRYRLEKVDITRKENVKYLRLYRLDIPVLFLNGQFLCMHRLNVDLLDRRLKELERTKQ